MKKSEIEFYQKQLLNWYQKNHRTLPWRETSHPYYIWVSEVMLQQTQVKTVIPYFERFIQKFPTIFDFAAADEDTILKMWEGLGYYSRIRNFHKAAKIIVADYNGEIPDDRGMFIQQPGVGDYIASAVLSIAFHQPYAVVDGNVKRVLARLLLLSEPVNDAKNNKLFQKQADKLLAAEQPGSYNQAVMELGALVCKPATPDCLNCPIQNACKAFSRGKVGDFPKRLQKKPVPTKHIAVGVVIDNNKLLITKRKSGGLLGGLWEFPGGKINKGEMTEQACVREIKEETGLNVVIEKQLTAVKHAYTHFKIEMAVFICRKTGGGITLDGPVDHRWISPGEIEKYPFPGSNHQFIPRLKEYLKNI